MTTILTTSARDATPAVQPAQQSCARREALWLGAVLVAGLLLRLALLWRFDGMGLKVWDEGDYDRLAANLVRSGEYAFEPGQPTSLRPPLYPALVAGIYRVAGIGNYQAVRLVQIGLGLATAAAVYAIGRSAYGPRAGLIAATICCFYPSLVVATNLVLTETLFTLLVCLFVLAMQRYLASAARTWLVAAGMSLGLAALTRSVLWLFPPLAFVYLLVLGREQTWLGRLASALALVLAFALTLAPWTIRNTLLQNTFTTVDVMGGRNVMMGNYEHTLEDRPWATIELQGERSWHNVLAQKESLKGKTQGQVDKLALRYAIDYVRAHPVQTIRRSAAKFFHFWQLERELIAGAQRGLWGNFSKPAILGLAAVILGAYVATMAAGIFGAWMCPMEMRLHVLLLLLIAFVTGLHALAFGHSRYHLPLMPLVILYAAAAIDRWRNVLGSWRSIRFAAAATCLVVLATSWGLEIKREISRFGSNEPAPVTSKVVGNPKI
ncbi:MAG TPA: glycosyltransferase family 39 protein [Pirellulaceae bacterium]|nr:glycosyltransferase family 39 protein [Pirellulaceae bacterium]